jgi:hypothetical protein
MNVTGGYTGFVLQEQAIKSFQFLPGSQYVWQYTEVEGARGCVAPYSVAAVGSTTFYLAEDGFYSIDVQAGLKPIGATRVNNWWRDNTDASRRSSIMAVADPVAPRIYWVGYSTAGVTSFDIGLVYDWQLDQWAEFRTSAQVFAAIATPGKSLEDLNAYGSLENVPASLDSSIWEGDKPTFGGISSASKLIFMSGASLEATMVLPRVQANPGGRAFVNEVRPVIDTEQRLSADRDGRADAGPDCLWIGSVSRPDRQVQRAVVGPHSRNRIDHPCGDGVDTLSGRRHQRRA